MGDGNSALDDFSDRGDALSGHWLNPPASLRGKVIAAALLLTASLLTVGAVYATGGTRYGFPHVCYLPILLAASLFGVTGGLSLGLLAGLLLGPWAPSEVGQHFHAQTTLTWMVRLTAFTVVGGFAGMLMNSVRRQQKRLRWLAFHSVTTGLPTRPALAQAIEALMQPAGPTATHKAPSDHTLLVIRINNFDQIVNALGVPVGDELLQALVSRLGELDGQALRVFDLGGGTLGLIHADARKWKAFVEEAPHKAARPVVVAGIPIYVDAVVGSADVDPLARSPSAIIQRASIALARAEREQRFHAHYQDDAEARSQRNVELLASLPQAIRQSELFLEYQPKVHLHSGQPAGAEALVRWRHPSLGVIPPGDFIPLAEGSALIHPLTRFVFAQAVTDLAALRGSGLEGGIAVNLSARNLADPALLHNLFEILDASPVPADRIELEVTESAIMNRPKQAVAALTALRARGIRISIDDFGTGYTSLQYLADLPVDGIKIDQVFIRRLLHDRRNREIVQAVIDLAKKLGFFTIAEGIEDEATATALAEMGCDMGQGYHFARPMPACDLSAWLRRPGARASA
jgi:EAL domain-containing protein (putative c-di-GMP-specific phosphodiesterase class I)/GGDEF domain-containing protein